MDAKYIAAILGDKVDTANLAAWWKLHDGTTTDYSGGGNTGVANGTDIAPAYPGFVFNGTDDYIDTNDTFQSTFRDSFTMSVWSKTTDGQLSQYLFGVLDATGADSFVILAIHASGTIQFIYAAEALRGQDAITDEVVLNDGQETWHHFCGVADSTVNGVGGKKIYLDGVEQVLDAVNNGSTLDVVFANFDNSTPRNLFIGAYNSNGVTNNFFGGDIDDAQIYNVAKSADEVRSIYEQSRGRYSV